MTRRIGIAASVLGVVCAAGGCGSDDGTIQASAGGSSGLTSDSGSGGTARVDGTGATDSANDATGAGEPVQSCQPDQTLCGGLCVALAADPANCGQCGSVCVAGQGCVGGACICPSGTALCGAACIDVTQDAFNCGGCNVLCQAGQLCQAGMCVCQPGLTDCFGACADLGSDGNNCGACGAVCQPGQVCSAGSCGTTCTIPGQTACGTSCVNLLSDPLNCGQCSVVCPTGQLCTQGLCSCPAGLTACSGQCVDLMADPRHCGGCAVVCFAAQSCVGGVCEGGPDGTGGTAGAGGTGGVVTATGGMGVGGAATGGTAAGGTAAGGAATGGVGTAGAPVATGGDGSAGEATGGLAGAGAESTGSAAGTGGDPQGGAAGSAGAGTGGEGTGGAGTGGEGGSNCGDPPAGHYQMEDVDRGLVAVRVGNSNYVGWRMFGYEYNRDTPSAVSYNVYRDGSLAANITDSTNYLDSGGSASSSYAVSAVINGTECSQSAAVTPWSQNYLRIPLSAPGSNYSANDGSTGDLDGDGQYDIVLKWDPDDARDNSQSGVTSDVYLDGITLGGTRLWRSNLGPNIRAGAHYTQFVVYDFDGDGRSELAVKTAPGTRDGTGAYLSLGPAANDDDGAVYRNGDGYVLSGPEYLSVFDGTTGAELATVDFQIARGTVSSWGDSYGNRVDRFLASAGFVSDAGGAGQGSGGPSILTARGYYTRATVTAWNWRNGELTRIWTADSNSSGSGALAGQGAHSMSVADVDGDNAQEIVYGAAMIQSDGSFGCSTGYGHGDALHVTDLIPSRAGLEVFMPHEDTSQQRWSIRDANTCSIIHDAGRTGKDTGRGVAADVTASNPGAEMWASDTDSGETAQLRSCTTGADLGGQPSSINFVVWWDGDEVREVEDSNRIDKPGVGRLLTADGCSSNNGTKSTPTLTADLLGDWREEVIWRETDNSALRLYTTTDVTSRRIYTLMHDPQYRMQVSSEQAAYNQPPHTSFHIGDGMADPPRPDIHVR